MAKSKLEQILSQLEGDYSVKKAKDLTPEGKMKTGVFALDYILSGGITNCLGGHRLEFFGAESSCKTTFVLHIVKKFQEEDKTCVFIDGENSYDTEWAEIVGVDNNKLLIFTPASLEEVGDLYVKLIPEADLIITDSIVSLIPEAEIERDTSEMTMALQARVNSLITRKIYKAIADQNTTMIFINQLREKLGAYGNPYTTGGGRALKHLYNTRIEFKSGKPIDIGAGDKKERIGYEINLKTVKNKKGAPHKKAIIDFYFNGSIDNKKGIFWSGLKLGIIQLNGKTYQFGKIKVVGKDKMVEALEGHYEELEKRIWEVLK